MMKLSTKQIKIITILLIIISVASIVGITYAYFVSNVTGNTASNANLVTMGTLSVNFTDGNAMEASNIVPGWSGRKTFTVTNTGTNTAYYSIGVIDMVNTFARTEDLHYTISVGPAQVVEGIVLTGDRTISPIVALEPGASRSYSLAINYLQRAVDQSTNNGKVISFKININSEKNPNIGKTNIFTLGLNSRVYYKTKELSFEPSTSLYAYTTYIFPAEANKTYDLNYTGSSTTAAAIQYGSIIEQAEKALTSTAALTSLSGNTYGPEGQKNYLKFYSTYSGTDQTETNTIIYPDLDYHTYSFSSTNNTVEYTTMAGATHMYVAVKDANNADFTTNFEIVPK